MPRIFIDNKPYEAKDGLNLLQACLNLGFEIPYFCWHPALHSVGSCRLCAVKQFRDEADTRGRIIMSCVTPVAENMRISIDDPEVKEFRAGIIELLMLNHPHDCPVCDEGGECHLQDMTLLTGHVYRRTRFPKRTFRNQYLGPFLNHEMNRCIHCYRCVRFYRDFAGGRDFEAFSSHDHVYFGRHEDGVLQSPFSGNLAEVCPTGVFTDRTFKRHFTRSWDLQTAPSICVHCGLGCNTIPGERYGSLRRIRNRYNSAVNRYFLCDRGRFGYEFVNHDFRIRKPVIKKSASGHLQNDGSAISTDELHSVLAKLLHFGAGVIGIGSPRASLEANYALRSLVGRENFFAGMSEQQASLVGTSIDILRKGPARPASLYDVSQSDAVLILGEDVSAAAPLLDLTLRQAVQNRPKEDLKKFGIPEWNDIFVKIAIQERKGPLFVATPEQTGLDELAEQCFRAAPDDIARLGFAVAHEIDPSAPEVPDAEEALVSAARAIAGKLMSAARPLIISGTGGGDIFVLQAAANVASALIARRSDVSLCLTMPECNSLGLGLLHAGDLDKAFATADAGNIETAIILENDLYRRAGAETVDKFLDRVPNVIVLDYLENRTTGRADIALPSASFAETGGIFVNNEGRAQRFFRVFVPEGNIEEAWRWLCGMMAASGRDEGRTWKNSSDICAALSAEFDIFAPLQKLSETPDVRLPESRLTGQKIPRQSHRFSGRTAISADKTVHEPKPPDDDDSPMSFSMEGYPGKPPSSLLPRYWAPGWNSVQAVTKFQREVNGPLLGGDTGQRLIEPDRDAAKKEFPYFGHIPKAFKARKKKLLVVPLYHIFGSEELSAHAPAIAELTLPAYVALNAEEAANHGVAEGEYVNLGMDGESVERVLPVKISAGLPHGVAGLPVGLRTLEGIQLPAWAEISGKTAKPGMEAGA